MPNSVGLVIGSAIGPERLADAARRAEASGFSDLWLAEDFFFTGGIAGANIALGSTESIRVGLGVVSAVVRHPALLAMEIATTARAFPGRFLPGIGLGVPAWMRQMGVMPRSPLAAVRECVAAVRRLLDGQVLSQAGEVFTFDQVELVYPQVDDVPLHLGVIGPRMLELSGSVADGSILSVGAGEAYVRWARSRIDAGRETAGRDRPHHVTVFTIYSVDEDHRRARAEARSALAFYKAAGGRNALTDVAGISDRLVDMLARGGAETVEAEMPEDWVDALTVAGRPEDVVSGIKRLLEAGADSIALFPAAGDRAGQIIDLTASEVLPRL